MKTWIRWRLNNISQFLIDYCEGHMHTAQQVGMERALRYGDKSWQWKWTFWQERIWDKLGWACLRKVF